jgi:hypothetical protein
VSPPLDFWTSLFGVLYVGDSLHFFNQGGDIELIAVLVNKKASIDRVNRLKKFNIAKNTLSGGLQYANRAILYNGQKFEPCMAEL